MCHFYLLHNISAKIGKRKKTASKTFDTVKPVTLMTVGINHVLHIRSDSGRRGNKDKPPSPTAVGGEHPLLRGMRLKYSCMNYRVLF